MRTTSPVSHVKNLDLIGHASRRDHIGSKRDGKCVTVEVKQRTQKQGYKNVERPVEERSAGHAQTNQQTNPARLAGPVENPRKISHLPSLTSTHN